MGGPWRPRAASSLRSRAVALLVLGFASLVLLGAFEALDEGQVIAAEKTAVATRQVGVDNQALSTAITSEQTALKSYINALAGADRSPRGLGERDDLLNDYLTASGEARAAQKRLTDDATRAGVDVSTATKAAEAWQTWAAERRAAAEADPTRPADPAHENDGATLYATFAGDDRVVTDRLRTAELQATQRADDLNAAHARVFFSGLAIEALALLLLGIALILQVLSPLSKLTAAAANLAEGRATRVPYQERDDEVGSLARALGSWQQASAEMFRVFQRSPIGIARLSSDGHVLEANPSLEHMLGVKPGSLGQRHLIEMLAADDREPLSRQVRELVRGAQESIALEARHLRADGTAFWADVTLAAVPAEDGGRYLLAMVEDVDVRKRQELELRHRAGHDALTELPNRSLFEDRLKQAIHVARRRRGKLAVVVLDLDHFKPVNDELGHHAGDEVLRQVGRRLRHALRESDTLARLGGDEFAIVLGGEDATGAGHAIDKLENAMAAPFAVAGTDRTVGLSAGIAVYPDDGRDVSELLNAADADMYRAKRRNHQRHAHAAGAGGN